MLTLVSTLMLGIPCSVPAAEFSDGTTIVALEAGSVVLTREGTPRRVLEASHAVPLLAPFIVDNHRFAWLASDGTYFSVDKRDLSLTRISLPSGTPKHCASPVVTELGEVSLGCGTHWYHINRTQELEQDIELPGDILALSPSGTRLILSDGRVAQLHPWRSPTIANSPLTHASFGTFSEDDRIAYLVDTRGWVRHRFAPHDGQDSIEELGGAYLAGPPVMQDKRLWALTVQGEFISIGSPNPALSPLALFDPRRSTLTPHHQAQLLSLTRGEFIVAFPGKNALFIPSSREPLELPGTACGNLVGLSQRGHSVLIACSDGWVQRWVTQ